MIYILQVTVYTGLMLLIYLLLLRDRPMHRFNRFYLLSADVLPVVLPFIQLPSFISPKQDAGSLITGTLPEMVIITGGSTGKFLLPGWLTIIAMVYITVSLTIALVKISGYIKMWRIISRSDREERDGYTLLKHTGYGPGSWGKYIFLPEGDVDENIIKHELVHIQLHHSLDIIFISCMQVIMWPNIFLYMLKKELVQVHEFQADAAVEMETEAYSNLLLSCVFKTGNFPLAHSFINHPIKRRIMMLHKNKTSGKIRGIVAIVLAVAALAGIVTIQSCEQKQTNDAVIASGETTKKQDSVFSFVHKMPEADYDVYGFLGKVMTYPAEAKEKGIEGRVMVKFVVDKTGKIRDIEVASKKTDPILADAALKAVAQLPDWQPGEDEQGNKVAVYYSLPVSFKLGHDAMSLDELKQLPEPLQFRIYGELYDAVLKNKGIPRIREDLNRIHQSLDENKDVIHKEIEAMQAAPEKYKAELEHVNEAQGLLKDYNRDKN